MSYEFDHFKHLKEGMKFRLYNQPAGEIYEVKHVITQACGKCRKVTNAVRVRDGELFRMLKHTKVKVINE